MELFIRDALAASSTGSSLSMDQIWGPLVLVILAAVIVWHARRQKPYMPPAPGSVAAERATLVRTAPPPPAVVVKTYKGAQKDAAHKFQADARTMAQRGYMPISQSYAAGSYGGGDFLIALVLCFVIIGILIFIAMLVVKPAGTLSVTYEYRPKLTVPDLPAAEAAAEKICPRCAETVKAAAKVCRYCGHAFPDAPILGGGA